MELDDFLDKLKILKSIPFLKGSGVEETLELGFKVFRKFHETLKANTITIGNLKKELGGAKRELAVLKKRLEHLEDQVYGDE